MHGKFLVIVNKLINATKHSLAGLKMAFAKEWAFRVELLICALLLPVVFFLARDYIHGLILFGTLCLVLITELFNTAIERVVDRVSLENHPLSKEAKDIASSGVFLAIVFAVVTWGYSIFF